MHRRLLEVFGTARAELQGRKLQYALGQQIAGEPPWVGRGSGQYRSGPTGCRLMATTSTVALVANMLVMAMIE